MARLRFRKQARLAVISAACAAFVVLVLCHGLQLSAVHHSDGLGPALIHHQVGGFVSSATTSGAQNQQAAQHRTQKNAKSNIKSNATKKLAEQHIEAPPNIPQVWDVVQELAVYEQELYAKPIADEKVAQAAQQRVTAAEMGITAADPLNELDTLTARIEFLNALAAEVKLANPTRVAITTTWSGGLWGLRREFLPWMQIMTELGVCHFYVLFDGKDKGTVAHISLIEHVTLMYVSSPFATAKEIAEFEAWKEWHPQWTGKPGNYELMVKQGYGMDMAIDRALVDGMDWLLHTDADEVVYPMKGEVNLATVLQQQPHHVSSLRFLNVEGQPEAGDLTNRYEQVALFRTHQHHAQPAAFTHRGRFRLGANRSYLNLYANGKSAVRVVPGVRQLGPHYWRGNSSPRWKTQQNPYGLWQTDVSEDCIVLHYAYSYMSDVQNKANMSCPAEYLEPARQGDRAKVKDCFIIDIDQDAYMVAATSDQKAIGDFFWSRMVFSEGARVRCGSQQDAWCILHDVEHLKLMLIRLNLMMRVHGVQLILKQHEKALRRILAGRQQHA